MTLPAHVNFASQVSPGRPVATSHLSQYETPFCNETPRIVSRPARGRTCRYRSRVVTSDAASGFGIRQLCRDEIAQCRNARWNAACMVGSGWRGRSLISMDRSKNNFPVLLPLTLPSPASGEGFEAEVVVDPKATLPSVHGSLVARSQCHETDFNSRCAVTWF